MKLLTVIGARPQFIKASAVSRAIQATEDVNEIIVHTGQHFQGNMSEVFFSELGIPRPNHHLDIHGVSHGAMTGRMLEGLEKVMLHEGPDRVLVYGDTNSTLAGALAAAKLHVPVAHVEAGLRSFNMKMPEEINRILTDQVSDLLFCPTDAAVRNLEREGFEHKHARVLKVGDVMQDSALMFAEHAAPPLGLDDRSGFILATMHRAENTDDPVRLAAIVEALGILHRDLAEVVLPLHPRTRHAIANEGLELAATVVDPVGYLGMLWLLKHCGLVLTDSGGVQKEAFFFGKACVTLRDETEWVELIQAGANVLVGADRAKIVAEARRHLNRRVQDERALYGGGRASQAVLEALIAN